MSKLQLHDVEDLAKKISQIFERESPKVPRDYQRVWKLVAQMALRREADEKSRERAAASSEEVLVPSTSVSSLKVDELSRDRMGLVEADIEELRRLIHGKTWPPFCETDEDYDPALASVIDEARTNTREWIKRDVVESRGGRRLTEAEFAAETAEPLRRIGAKSLLDLPKGAWDVLRELSEETGFGVGQLLYHVLTGEEITVPVAVIEPVRRPRPLRPGLPRPASRLVVRIYRPITDRKLRPLHRAMRAAWRETPGGKARGDDAFLEIVNEALEGESHPWGDKAWKKVHDLWVKRKMPTRKWSSLRSRYQRLVEKVLEEVETGVEYEPGKRWGKDRWEGPIRAGWKSAGMLDLGWQDLWIRMRRLLELQKQVPPEDEAQENPGE